MHHDTLVQLTRAFLLERGCSITENGALSEIESLDYFSLLLFVETTFATSIDVEKFYEEGIPESETLENLCSRLMNSQQIQAK